MGVVVRLESRFLEKEKTCLKWHIYLYLSTGIGVGGLKAWGNQHFLRNEEHLKEEASKVDAAVPPPPGHRGEGHLWPAWAMPYVPGQRVLM